MKWKDTKSDPYTDIERTNGIQARPDCFPVYPCNCEMMAKEAHGHLGSLTVLPWVECLRALSEMPGIVSVSVAEPNGAAGGGL